MKLKGPEKRSLMLRERIASMRKAGMNYVQIGDILCLTPSAIGYHARAIGMPGQQGNPNWIRKGKA